MSDIIGPSIVHLKVVAYVSDLVDRKTRHVVNKHMAFVEYVRRLRVYVDLDIVEVQQVQSELGIVQLLPIVRLHT